MNSREGLSGMDLEILRAFDTCTVSNAVERLSSRPRNEGFVNGSVRCRFPELPPMVGYAVTGRIRTISPPMTHRCYHDRMDWWSYVASVPKPRVIVVQDADAKAGLGAFIGEIHASIGAALDCVGCVTNGAARDLPGVRSLKFQVFSGKLSVSHSYAHIIDFNEPVEIGGLKINSGDLLHGDLHGVLNIPLDIAAQIAAEATRILTEERELVEFCRSSNFSLDELARRMRLSPEDCNTPWRRH